MRCIRSIGILAVLAMLAVPAQSCKKGASKEDSGATAGEPSESAAEEETPAAAGAAATPATAASPSARTEPAEPEAAPATAAGAAQPAAANPNAAAPAQVQPPPSAGPRVALPDPRLLLTLKDVQDLSKDKVPFRRVALQGVPVDEDNDGILYEPEKGSAFGAALQVFRGRNAEAARDHLTAMVASYPSAQEIPPVVGKTFFAYWEEILYVGFLVPSRNLVVVLSCGRKYCDSDGLYELARKVGARTNG